MNWNVYKGFTPGINKIVAARETKSKCPHCKAETTHGTHMGCHQCGKVKTATNGRFIRKAA